MFARSRIVQARPRWRGPRISLALQGGGAHGAFTWGVLDRLLEENLRIEGISGASAGAMNAAVLGQGLLDGGNAGAREALARFWRDVSALGQLSPMHSTPLEQFFSGWNRDWSPRYLLMRGLSRVASPYQLNPLNINPLVGVIERHVDFEALKAQSEIKLFISVTSVQSGQLRVLRTRELSAKSLAASACLPMLFQAVEIDGEHYWDGGYTGNPPLLPLMAECRSRDVLLIQLCPLSHERVPMRLSEIADRAAEISFNSGLLRELEMVALLRRPRLLPSLDRMQRGARRARLHHLHPGGELQRLGQASRINTERAFLEHLRDLGRQEAESWLARHGRDIGRRASADLTPFDP